MKTFWGSGGIAPPCFCVHRRNITVLTKARHWIWSLANLIQSTTSHSVSSRSILILSFRICLGLPSGAFPSDQSFIYSSVGTIRATCAYCRILLVRPFIIYAEIVDVKMWFRRKWAATIVSAIWQQILNKRGVWNKYFPLLCVFVNHGILLRRMNINKSCPMLN